MKSYLARVGVVLGMWLTLVVTAHAGATVEFARDASAPEDRRVVLPRTEPFPLRPALAAAPVPQVGTQLAQTISQLTGVAISPLLGTSAVGAWRYFDTPKAQRATLPWFAQPWFWAPALVLVGLIFAKDVLGPATPTALKKPIDAVELFENKLSGLIAAGAFVPLLMGLFGDLPRLTQVDPAAAGFAAATSSTFVNALLTPFAMIAFVVVWLLGHVIHVLILLSPFTTVDTALKAIRTALLATVVGTSFVNPWVGAVWALAIIGVAALLAGWSFRLTVLGSVFLWDFFTVRRKRFTPDPEANWVFLARDVAEAPLRTYGRLCRGENRGLRFEYRPFLLGHERAVELPAGTYCVGRGLLYSDLLLVEGDNSSARLGIFPPRYRGHDMRLTEVYRLAPPDDVGLRAVGKFFKELLGLVPAPAPGVKH